MRVYIHIPFCAKKCLYCKFPVVIGRNEEQISAYLSRLHNEIRDFFVQYPNETIESIYFGGGSPSILKTEELQKIFIELRQNATFLLKTEITIELHPQDVNEEYIDSLIDIGFTRVSVGVQTLQSKSLVNIARTSLFDIEQALQILKNKPQLRVSVDFIIGLPYTTGETVLKDIEDVLEKYPNIAHMSVYMLEEGVYPSSWKNISPSDEEIGKIYISASSFLEKQGWERYEVSNFCKNGEKSEHNQGYWTHEEYRGFGMAAASFWKGERFTNPLSLKGYLEKQEGIREKLTNEQLRLERILFGLRTNGVNKKDIDTDYANLLAQDLIFDHGEKIVLNPN